MAVSASGAAVARRMEELVSDSDCSFIESTQVQILKRLQHANLEIARFNDHSRIQFALVAPIFTQYTKTMKELKKDLDVITKRIRALRIRLVKVVPQAESENPFREGDDDD
eukprot:TRINITY_DN7643_c0_g1_i1.p1 TRINITY_DN7643_c0_g1~~TRINITY_DN7643_c0_g1_i1.p1  ORF type:complete len:111 (+),score=9.42 TRINITY_DN7643_c0_g1_i1:45-377(+)